MSASIIIAVVGDRNPGFLPHDALEASIQHEASRLARPIETRWLPTAELERRGPAILAPANGIWAAPGSPYASMQGMLGAIRHARQNGIPLLATCGGCQHVVIEFARHVLGVTDAQHAEYEPSSGRLFITPLTCSLKGQTLTVELHDDGIREMYGGRSKVAEQYYCDFGVNPAVEPELERGGLRVVGRDPDGGARILTISGHPFFVATLFVPALTSTPEQPHPLVAAFIHAAGRQPATPLSRLAIASEVA